MIRRIVLVLIASLVVVSAYAAEIDKVLVVVNDSVITESEFQQTLARIKSDLKARGGEAPPEAELKKQVLNRMILQEIERQLAKRAGITVSDQDLNDALADIAKRNHLKPDQLKPELEKEGMDYDLLRDNIRTQMLSQRLAERQVARDVVVTDDEVDAYLSQPRAKTTQKRTRYNISHILLSVSSSAGSDKVDAVRKKAEEVRRKIENGMPFAEAAKSYSQADDALDGGSLGWRVPSQLPDLFLNALNQIDKGGVTQVIRSPAGFHILKLNDVEGGSGPEEVTQYKVRHILIRTDEFTSVKEATDRLEKIRERIENGEDFGEMALAHSDDTVSSVQGGELGWISPGDTVKPFEDAVEKLKVGEISEPVKTPYGVHIIQLEDTRQAKPKDMDRSLARRHLRAVKTQEKMEEWRDKLRDQAYVKIVNPVSPDT